MSQFMSDHNGKEAMEGTSWHFNFIIQILFHSFLFVGSKIEDKSVLFSHTLHTGCKF